MPRNSNAPADQVVSNSTDPTPLDPVSGENESLRVENAQLHEKISMLADRLLRIEAVQSSAKLRKYDEQNDPSSLRHVGRVLSMDAKDPILFLKKTGDVEEVTAPGNGQPGSYVDNQVLHGKTLSGKDVSFTFRNMILKCSGNSIPCVINNYKEYREQENMIMQKKKQYQSSNGKTSRVNTVELKQEIKQLEEQLRMNVTLSEDDGKTYTGATCDIHPISVLNACP